MNNEDSIKQFKDFLMREGCLKEFEEELFDDAEYETSVPDNYLAVAFVWDATKQGFDFWSTLDFKWQNELKDAKDRTDS